MPDKLTELTGIGEKTAEKLRDDGIDSPDELAEEYRTNPRRARERGQRVQSAARDALFESRDSFRDPVSGAEVTEENRAAFEKIAARPVSDFDSISVDGANSSVFPDNEVRDFIEPVQEGRFKTQVDGDDNLLAFAADAAQNLGVDELSSGELQDVNRAAESAQQEITFREKGSVGTTKATGTTTAGEFFRAQGVHQERSRKARRIDERRKAERTTDFKEWKSDPSRHDFPGVDTPADAGDVLPEERTSRNRGGFGSSKITNTDRSTASRAFDTLGELNDKQQDRLFGESFDPTNPL